MTHSLKKEVKIFKSVYLFLFSKIKKMDVSVSCDPPPPTNSGDVTHVDHGLNDSECSLNAVFST